MKRNAPAPRRGGRSGDIRRDLTKSQLAAIGAVAFAWNECEHLLDILTARSLSLPSNIWEHVTTRINGSEGKREIIRLALTYHLHLQPELRDPIEESLSDFATFKGYRDAIIHARVWDVKTSIGHFVRQRGKTEEVLLTLAALNGLYRRLVILRTELTLAIQVASLRRKTILAVPGTISDPHVYDHRTLPLEPEAQALIVQVRRHQSRRKSLKPLPKFPETQKSPEILAAIQALRLSRK